ncbi:MAG: hypothetical protein NTW85_11000 [Methylococcales bacterium]|nr:hypothetical protein [Methylococcales bacterium]
MEKQELIENAAKCALNFLEGYSSADNIFYSYVDNKIYAYQAFKALAELTLADLNTGKSVEECRYDAMRIAGKIQKEWDKEDKEKIMKVVKGYMKTLIDRISDHTDSFIEIAGKNNLLVIPTVKKSGTDGGSGNRNLYYIDYENVETQENIDKNNLLGDVNKDDLPKNYVNYFVEHIKLPRITNWIYNYEFSGFRFSIEIMAFILVWVITAIFGIYIINMVFYGKFSISDFPIIGMYFFTALFFKRKWDCLRKRVISINPPLTANPRFTFTQLECVATDEIRESTGNPIRRIQLVSYWATCPICKNTLQRNVRIDVENGGREFHHRLIGRCSESPTEHVYSFDRVTRIGKPLR